MGTAMRDKISKRTVDLLGPGEILLDTELKGFVARKLPSGRISYGLKYTDSKSGRQRWLALGLHGALTPELARRRAQTERGRIAAGTDPQAEKEAEKAKRVGIVTVNDLLDAHISLYVMPRKLRSHREIARAYDKYIRPMIGKVPLRDLRRSHVVGLLDTVATKNGPVMADRVLAYLRKPLNWHATRDDEFVVPIVRGMAQTSPRERARDRILTDDEIRALWKATERSEAGNYGVLVRVLLLTAQRRQEVGGMRHAEIAGNIWTIAGERAKNSRPNTVPLTATITSLIGALPVLGDYIFGQLGRVPFGGFSTGKLALDRRMKLHLGTDADWRPWTVHDLRRTARSLMSRAGIRPEIAERVLNHVISGVQGVYDRHDYVAEKQAALESLDMLINRILDPAGNVVQLDSRRQVSG
jgi:integrase